MASDAYFNLVKAAKHVWAVNPPWKEDLGREFYDAILAAEDELEPWQREELKCQQ